MENYVKQLLTEIETATENACIPSSSDWRDWLSEDEENATAPIRNLQEWTGISYAGSR